MTAIRNGDFESRTDVCDKDLVNNRGVCIVVASAPIPVMNLRRDIRSGMHSAPDWGP